VTLAQSTLSNYPSRLVVDASNVYWTEEFLGTVMKVPTGGGTSTVLASQQAYPNGIAQDANNVYWVNAGGTVMKVSKNGGAPTTLVSGAYNPIYLAVDDTSVYFTSLSTSSVYKVSKNGGPLTTLAANQSSAPNGIALYAANVYWVNDYYNGATGAVWKISKLGGTPTMLAPDGGQEIAVDATSVYWANITVGTIKKVPLAGGGAITLVSGQGPQGLAVDATGVYWTNNPGDGSSSSVMKVALGGAGNDTRSRTVRARGDFARCHECVLGRGRQWNNREDPSEIGSGGL
jgi:sugar lactone lactonase YvrE